MKASKVAATALLTAIEMLEDHPLLRIGRETKLPLLTPFNSSGLKEIAEEVEQRLADGFRTFKIKVGADAVDDAQRVKAIQQAIAGRTTMRLDAAERNDMIDALATDRPDHPLRKGILPRRTLAQSVCHECPWPAVGVDGRLWHGPNK
jgi:Enolase C-terminal domain-like